MVSIQQLTKILDGKTVLNIPQHNFASGQVHGIVGLNGAGKTTFFNILSTFLKADSGKILFEENEILRNSIAYLETVNFFFSNITGREYLDIFPMTNKNFNLNNFNELLQLPLDEITETYSTGMKKKLALMAIIKQEKPLYIFDEPFNGLDLETNKVLEFIIKILKNKGKTIFISSHILSPLITMCDEIHLLQAGTFRSSYQKETFCNIEHDLFQNLNAQANEILGKSF
ncbi:MAG: ATP-binding cassette domain-containing protein [Bacteroidetes bacterium]|nr:ATP-binding cassette domain-containing protein [Bacteroidota bacterium]